MKNYILLIWDRNEEYPELYLIPRNDINDDEFHLLDFANRKYLSVKDQDNELWTLKFLIDNEWEKYFVTHEMLKLSDDQHIERVITSGFVL